jgi:hypothetical protein
MTLRIKLSSTAWIAGRKAWAGMVKSAAHIAFGLAIYNQRFLCSIDRHRASHMPATVLCEICAPELHVCRWLGFRRLLDMRAFLLSMRSPCGSLARHDGERQWVLGMALGASAAHRTSLDKCPVDKRVAAERFAWQWRMLPA